MTMTIMHNDASMTTLGILNKNSSSLAKDLKKVSSGMKLTSAGDDASGYAISERMRAQIRSLAQDTRNTQNGTALLKVAEGAVSSTVDILRTLKAKAIDAANDTNTDTDRATLQKELDQSADQIDDNALVTFNGKYLVDGSHNRKIAATKTARTNEMLSTATTGTTAFTAMADRNGESLAIQSGDTVTMNWVKQGETHSVSVDGIGTTEDLLEKANAAMGASVTSATRKKWTINGVSTYDANEVLRDVDLTISCDIDTVKGTHATPSGMGFSVNAIRSSLLSYMNKFANQTGQLTSASDMAKVFFKNVTFKEYGMPQYDGTDAGKKAVDEFIAKYRADVAYTDSTIVVEEPWPDSYFDRVPSVVYKLEFTGLKAADGAPLYINYGWRQGDGGYMVGFEYMPLAGLTESDWMAFNPMKNQFPGIEIWSDPVIESEEEYLEAKGEGAVFEPMTRNGSELGDDGTGGTVTTADGKNAVTITAYPSGLGGQVAGLTFKVTDSQGKVRRSATEKLNAFDESIRAENASEDNALVIHTGTKANQNVKVYLTDMRTEALGLKSSTGATISIGTQTAANAAINVLDTAVQKALDEQTRIGAYESRLDFTAQNLTTAEENVTASESTIRDADMAKEMTSYMKHNVLLQASQSMLAQANQTSSNALSLLQG